jgi:hypothetical protein
MLHARRIRWLTALCLAVAHARAAQLRFDHSVYDAVPGQPFQVRVLLDMDESLPGDQMPPPGLLTLGLRVTFDPTNAVAGGASAILLPPEMNDNGLGGPPVRETGPGYAGAYGARPPPPIGETGYTNPLLVTITLTNLSARSFTIRPGLFYSSTLANFTDFDGGVMDGTITNFVPATVRVAALPGFTAVGRPQHDRLRLRIEVTNFTPEALTLRGASSLIAGSEWTPVSGVVWRTNAPGRYEADVPYGAASQRFFRVGARP